ncbi:RICIN domain-containing protein, partial [Streptomyces sp. S3(2020)]|uniref:RICIN domain-containing protein n=1 Tax=Streptomyces sp. S3(2020) TaxID=2732044 RepID=UPI001487E1F2
PSATEGGPLATVALENTGTGRCLRANSGESPDNPPEPAVCAAGDTQEWRVVAIAKSAYALEHVASGFCLDIAGDRVQGDPMQLRPCAYRQGADAPFPEDQAFLLRARADGTFTVVCQENPEIAVGVRAGEVRMLATAGSGKEIRFALDDGLAKALGG